MTSYTNTPAAGLDAAARWDIVAAALRAAGVSAPKPAPMAQARGGAR